MASNPPETPHRQALEDLNRAFLALLCAVPPGEPAFGLEPAVLQRLRALPAEGREALARSPVLLAGCRRPPALGPAGGVAEDRPAARPGREPPCEVFAAALLTWLVLLNRADPLAAALHTGPEPAMPEWLRQAGFRDIERAAAAAPAWLEARFSANARLWPDLVRAAAAGEGELLAVTRLSFVQLSLVAPRANPKPGPGRPSPG